MHPLLERQLRRHFGSLEEVPRSMQGLIDAIDASYEAADHDRQRLERSMEVTSEELLQRHADLEDAVERLRETDRVRARFLNTAAHEINTPLTPILLQLRLLRRHLTAQPSKKDEAIRNVEVLERNITRLSMIASDFLDSARIESGAMSMDPKPVDVVQVARRCAEAVAAQAEKDGINLRCSGADDALVVADEHRLGQVMDNLIANALRFTDAGGRVDVRVDRDTEFVRVEVEDTGTGISKEGLKRLFHPFDQVHDTMQRTDRGTGLGLFISKGIIDQSGGRIGARSEGLGQGATFFFELPRAGATVRARTAGS